MSGERTGKNFFVSAERTTAHNIIKITKIPLTSLTGFIILSLLQCVERTNVSFYKSLVTALMKLTSILGLLAAVAVQFPLYVLSVHSKILFQNFLLRFLWDCRC